jgi:poly(A) polymerase
MTRIVADWLTAPATKAVCDMLTVAGHQAWFVGGCVRNALLGVLVADYDISTDALPDRVIGLAKAAGLRAVPTGFDHGTVTVVAENVAFEVTTFRRDVRTDGRRAVVAFADTIHEDALRRDFTINALYATPDGKIADPLGGLGDLETRRIRFIEDADLRIREDYLRILRFFRFHAWYGDPKGGIDAEGLAACAANIDGLASLSRERVGHEMLKLLAAPDPAPALASMAAAGVLNAVLPGATANLLPVVVHLEAEHGVGPDPIRRLASLGGEGSAKLLRLSGAKSDKLAALIDAVSDQMRAGELGYRLGSDLAISALLLRAATAGGENLPSQIEKAKYGAAEVFPIKAADLMPKLQGPALGAAIRDLERRWIASDFTLDRAGLLSFGDDSKG